VAKILFVLNFLMVSFLFAEEFNALEDNQTVQNEVYEQKVLYLNYEFVPKRVIAGEIFSITIKTLSIIPNIQEIHYSFSNQKSLKVLNPDNPSREIKGKFFYDTFYFKALSSNIRLPDIIASIDEEYGRVYKPTVLKAKEIESIKLNPPDDFCNIIAKDLQLVKYKTTSYDQSHNIIVFSLEAKQTMLEDFHINGIEKQGIESITDTIEESKMIYYVVVDKKIENFIFSYFNINQNRYIKLNIPVIVDDDSVATQSDLKPKDQSKQKIKIFIALFVVAFGIVMLLWKKQYIYIFFIIIPAIYIAYIMVPDKRICVKKDTKVRILPLENGTVFEVLASDTILDKISNTDNYIKVELHNHKIGWVKNEDICSN